MLILTRRRNQKVVFPNLGITVKVVDVSGKTVRLGIDAPREIRVVRDELTPFSEGSPGAEFEPEFEEQSIPESRPSQVAYDRETAESIMPNLNREDDERINVLVRQLDAANLAIHLAQNQLQQGRNEYAEESLQHAIDCLQEIEVAAGLIPREELTAVREVSRGYTIDRKKTALLLGGHPVDQLSVAKRLEESGFEVSLVPHDRTLDSILGLRVSQQPDLVLVLAEPGKDVGGVEEERADSVARKESVFCQPGGALPVIQLGALPSMRFTAKVDIAGCLATAWTSDDDCLLRVAG